MDSLIQYLQKTIEALETLSDSSSPEGEKIDELLDQLFQQKIDLVRVSLNVSSLPYQLAAEAMKQAAAKATLCAKEPARVGEATKAVTGAITKLSKLLDSVMPLG